MELNTSEINAGILIWLDKHSIKYEVNSFPSGAFMIDINYNHKFYTIQIDSRSIGISLIRDEPDFSTIPDFSFNNVKGLYKHMEEIFAETLK